MVCSKPLSQTSVAQTRLINHNNFFKGDVSNTDGWDVHTSICLVSLLPVGTSIKAFNGSQNICLFDVKVLNLLLGYLNHLFSTANIWLFDLTLNFVIFCKTMWILLNAWEVRKTLLHILKYAPKGFLRSPFFFERENLIWWLNVQIL